MASHCCNSETNCVCCNKTRIKASWDNCLDIKNSDLSANELCEKPVFIPANSTIQTPFSSFFEISTSSNS